MATSPEHDKRIAEMTFAEVYPHYITKIEKKGRTKEELLQVIEWLTSFNEGQLNEFVNQKTTFEQFFKAAHLNENAALIKGSICGYKIQEIQTPLTKQVRYLDKLVDELAKGKPIDKTLRKP